MTALEGEGFLRSGESTLLLQKEAEAYLQKAIQSGKNWFIALLEAVSLWTTPEETHQGRHYRYLIGGEAFDWLLLAERLCSTAEDVLPEDEVTDLLFQQRPPVPITTREFASLVGPAKYSAYLNFWYGVIVEEALQVAVREETEKSKAGQVLRDRVLHEEAFRRLYDEQWQTLFAASRASRGLPMIPAASLTETREFTYWLFKHRMRHAEPARIASDTRKGIRKLHELKRVAGLSLFIAEDEEEALSSSLEGGVTR